LAFLSEPLAGFFSWVFFFSAIIRSAPAGV
jgi:hypothetical protein